MRRAGVCPAQMERIGKLIRGIAGGTCCKTLTARSYLIWELTHLQTSAVDALAYLAGG